MPWDTYQKADLISDRELQLIKRYDKQDRTLQRSLLQEEDGVLYVRAFFSLLRSIASEEVVQYVLALLEDMIRVGGARSVALLGAAAEGEGSSDASAILLRICRARLVHKGEGCGGAVQPAVEVPRPSCRHGGLDLRLRLRLRRPQILRRVAVHRAQDA